MTAILRKLPMFLWLVLVWLLLWGSFDLGLVVLGVLVAVGVLALYPVRPVCSSLRPRPIALLRLVGYLVADLVISAVKVGWQVLRHGRAVRGAVVAVPVLSDVDWLVAAAANLLSLGPGKSVVQLDRAGRVFYVYALNPGDPARVREDVLHLQRRVLRAFGAKEDPL